MIFQNQLPHGAEYELRRVAERKREVRFEGNRFERLSSSIQAEQRLRLLHQGKLAAVKSTRPGYEEKLLQDALSLAPYGIPYDISFAGPSPLKEMTLVDEADLLPDEMIDSIDQVIQKLKENEPNLNITAIFNTLLQEISMETSLGFKGEYRKTIWYCDLRANLMQGDDLFALRSRRQQRGPSLDFADMIKEIQWILERGRTIVPLETGKYQVLFAPEMTHFISIPIFRALSGGALASGVSPLKENLGELMFDPRVTLIDDATLDGLSTSMPFDIEGTPTQRTALIDSGFTTGMLLDRYSAKLLGKPSSGNAEIGFYNLDSPLPQHLRLDPGEQSFEEMIRSIDCGVLVLTGMNNYSATAISGSIALGLKIDKGEIVGRIKNCMFGFNVFDYLRNHLVGFSKERKLVRDFLAHGHLYPYMLLNDVLISNTN